MNFVPKADRTQQECFSAKRVRGTQAGQSNLCNPSRGRPLPRIPIVGSDCSRRDRAIIPVEVSTWRTGQRFKGEPSLAARHGDLQCGGEGCGVVKSKILVGTSDGLHVAGEPRNVEFAGREVRSLVRTDAESWAIVDKREVWRNAYKTKDGRR